MAEGYRVYKDETLQAVWTIHKREFKYVAALLKFMQGLSEDIPIFAEEPDMGDPRLWRCLSGDVKNEFIHRISELYGPVRNHSALAILRGEYVEWQKSKNEAKAVNGPKATKRRVAEAA